MNIEFTYSIIASLTGLIIVVAWLVAVMGTSLFLFFSLIKYLLGG
jgi:hypothetical protein